MSTQRSSSGVRDLRAIFEDKSDTSASQERDISRGRSPAGSSADIEYKNNSPNSAASSRTRKVKTTFVPVEPDKNGIMSNSRRENISLHPGENKEELSELKKTVSQEVERRSSIPSISETIPEVAVTSNLPTPINEVPPASASITSEKVKPKGGERESSLKEMTLPSKETQSDHTEKLVSAVNDEEDVKLEPADPKTAPITSTKDSTTVHAADGAKEAALASTAAAKVAPEEANADGAPLVSNPIVVESKLPANGTSATLPPKPPAPDTSKGKPPQGSIITKPSTGPGPSVKSPRDKPPGAAARTPPKKSPTQTRQLPSHLMAPTASSAAKHEPEPKPEPLNKRTHPTKPVALSSHLMAPTAASAAKHETKPEPGVSGPTISTTTTTASKRDRTSILSKAVNQAGKRTSLARTSLASTGTTKPSTRSARTSISSTSKPASGDFLERMMRPTAASSSKVHDKVEIKSSPPSKSKVIPAKPKANGSAKPVADSKAVATSPQLDKTKKEVDVAAEVDRSQEAEPIPYRPVAVPQEPETISVAAVEPPKTPEKNTAVNPSATESSAEDSKQVEEIAKLAETPNFKGDTIH